MSSLEVTSGDLVLYRDFTALNHGPHQERAIVTLRF